MKVRIDGPGPALKLIPLREMRAGEYAVIHEKASGYNGHIVLRTWDRIISLTDPNVGWSDNANKADIPVKLLAKGESFVVEVIE